MAIELPGSRTGFNEAELMLMDAIRPVLEAHGLPGLLRQLLDDNELTPRALWDDLAEAGWGSLLWPEAAGGQGLGLSEAGAVMVETGRVLTPGPLTVTGAMAPLLLDTAGIDWSTVPDCDRLASGDAVVALAIWDSDTAFPSPSISTRLAAAKLSGRKSFVMNADMADWILAVANGDDDRMQLAWVKSNAEGVEIHAQPTIDGRRSCSVKFNGAAVATTHPVDDPLLLERFLMLASSLVVAQQVGGAERALGMAIDYAQQRVQFGRIIGTFQAVSHKLVDLYCSVELARALRRRAIRSISRGDTDVADALAVAKLYANSTFNRVTAGAIQTFGGIAITFEHDIHLYFRAAPVLAAQFGTSAQMRTHRRALAAREARQPQLMGA